MDEIHAYMNTNLVNVHANVSVLKASKEMIQHNVDFLLVEEGGKFIGIVTDVDFNRKVVATGADPSRTPISKIMTKPIRTIESHLLMPTALLFMHAHRIRHVVVTDKEQMVGILSTQDFVTYYTDKYKKGKPVESAS